VHCAPSRAGREGQERGGQVRGPVAPGFAILTELRRTLRSRRLHWTAWAAPASFARLASVEHCRHRGHHPIYGLFQGGCLGGARTSCHRFKDTLHLGTGRDHPGEMVLGSVLIAPWCAHVKIDRKGDCAEAATGARCIYRPAQVRCYLQANDSSRVHSAPPKSHRDFFLRIAG
jgi:hypothetical protein